MKSLSVMNTFVGLSMQWSVFVKELNLSDFFFIDAWQHLRRVCRPLIDTWQHLRGVCCPLIDTWQHLRGGLPSTNWHLTALEGGLLSTNWHLFRRWRYFGAVSQWNPLLSSIPTAYHLATARFRTVYDNDSFFLTFKLADHFSWLGEYNCQHWGQSPDLILLLSALRSVTRSELITVSTKVSHPNWIYYCQH